MLEVIDKGSSSESHPAPLLFVHGAWHAAWCWDEHFLDYFAEKGYRALAVSLRGHGGSPAQKRMQTCSVADFVNDVDSVANSLPTRPVVIGHSMGGFVVQKYLETHDAPAGVLVASMPTRGARGFMLRGMKRQPWHAIRAAVTTRSLHGYKSPNLAREYFYSPRTPPTPMSSAMPHDLKKSSLEDSRGTWLYWICPSPSGSLRRSWS
jgi:pimeloyl-ACP methyl ester carboxylesterase